MHKPIISYVIPCYNCETTLFDTVTSIMESDPDLWDKTEVLLINDGSTDSTWDIIETLSDLYTNIVGMNKENKGKGKTRNIGNMLAKADIIAVLDSDDWNLKDRTKTILKTFEENPKADVFYSSFISRFTFSNKARTFVAKEIDLESLWMTGAFEVCHSSVAYRKKVILEQPYSGDRNKDDWDMLFNFLKNGYAFCFSKDILVEYRVGLADLPNDYSNSQEGRILQKKRNKMKEYYRTLNEPIGETK